MTDALRNLMSAIEDTEAVEIGQAILPALNLSASPYRAHNNGND